MVRQLSDIGPLRGLIAYPPLGIISDVDGTLAPIVPRAEDAAITPRCRTLLRDLMERGVRVALATGRPLAVARAMLDLEGAAFAANHGLSLWLDDQEETPPAVAEYVGRARESARELAGLDVPGVSLEEKGPVLAVHYRRAADERAAREAILGAIAGSPAARAFRVHEGRKVIELRPPLDINKGTAVAALVPRLGARALICLGDDVTDIDMFREVRRLREGGLPGASIAVRNEEVAPEVVGSADFWLDGGVSGVEWLLQELLTALSEMPPEGREAGAPARK